MAAHSADCWVVQMVVLSALHWAGSMAAQKADSMVVSTADSMVEQTAGPMADV